MKKVLIISYYFPPVGGAGVQRILKFVKYLPEFSWEPVVLTVKNIQYPAYDASLLEEIPKGVKIYRSGSLDPLRLNHILGKFLGGAKKNSSESKEKSHFISWLSKFLFIPDNKIGWLIYAVIKGLKIAKKNNIDLIFSTSPPPTAHLIGLLLKKFLKVPLVVDFRDSWETSLEEKSPSFIHGWLQRKIERKILKNADSIITVNEQIQNIFQNKYLQLPNLSVVTNGYDEKDFRDVKEIRPDKFTVVYLGTFNRINDPLPFLQALSELSSEVAEFKNQVRFVHIGMTLDFNFSELIEKLELQKIVENKGYLSHGDSLKELSSASILLLITTDSAGAETLTTGKIFEYFRSGKPILGILPPSGAAASLIKENGAGVIVSPKNILGIKQILKDYFRKWINCELKAELDQEKLKHFERRHLTGKLVEIFNQVTQAEWGKKRN